MKTGNMPAIVFLIIVAPYRDSCPLPRHSSIVVIGGLQLRVRQNCDQVIQSVALPLFDFDQGFVVILQHLRSRFEFGNGWPGCQQVDDRVILEAWENPANIGVCCDSHVTSFPLSIGITETGA
jgi:hypothetical protein